MHARAASWIVVLCVAVVSCGGPSAMPRAMSGTPIHAAQIAPGPSGRAPAHWHDPVGLPAFPRFAPLVSMHARSLFIGNGFTVIHDLPAVYREITAPLAPGAIEASFTRGLHLTTFLSAVDHGQDAEGSARLAQSWDVVTLQEQSQVAGFPTRQQEYLDSQRAAVLLSDRVAPAAVVVYATWAREHGDPINVHLYPTFEAQEARVEIGYRAMADAIARRGHRVRIAPVGPAFARVREALIAARIDPERPGSAFDALYASDHYQPGPPGTYLAACVIASTITGRDPIAFADPDETLGLDAETAYALRLVARATLADPAWTPR